jgi:DNA-binding transcriptional regulator YiaG
MTPAEVSAARRALGMTQDQLAAALRMGADGKRAVRRWEAGDRAISGPASVAIEALLTGWRPA